jgi:hypothetical protein
MINPVDGPTNGRIHPQKQRGEPDVDSPDTIAQGPLQPEPLPRPRRKVDLVPQDLAVPSVEPVTLLAVRELRGPGAAFTADLNAALSFNAVVCRPAGTFTDVYQVIGGALNAEPRIQTLLRRIVFLPAFVWATMEFVLHPIRSTQHGQRVLNDLQSIRKHFPSLKTYIQWCPARQRHVVYRTDLSRQEVAILNARTWPTRDELLEALSEIAYDSIEELADHNENVRAILTAREVQ